MNPRTFAVRRISRNASCQPCFPVTTNVAVRGNNVYEVILPEFTSSKTRNPPEEWLFRRELPAKGLGGYRKNGFLLLITSSETRNLPEELNSAGNHPIIDADSGRQDQNARKILQIVKIPG
jgi:hypothetical protein